MKEIIKLRNVWKVYQMGEVEVYALRGLNLDVKKGEFLSVMGKSGSGKSTSLNMIGCLDVPTKGKIYLDGKDIIKLEESELAVIRGKKIGFIFQQFNLIRTLTALENVMMPMMFQNIALPKRYRRSVELLKMVGLFERMNHTPNQLSGGEMQRVAIARSLVNDPEVLLADEPTGNLDLNTGEKILELLKMLHTKYKKTIVIVTHDEDIAKKTERICYLEDGRIMKCFEDGRIKNIREEILK
jgi:putative ABC transport system ATP-binding protein